MTEPKVVRRNPRFGNTMPPDQVVQECSRADPNWHATFVEYIPADKWDKWVALALGIAVLIVIALDSAWLMGWLR